MSSGSPKASTRAAAVSALLRELIKSGELPPGTWLRQAQIADRFGVSTTPVREAFVALAREGLVRQDAHRGVVVFSPTVDELEELYEIRAALEPLATRLASEKMDEVQLEELAEIVDELSELTGTAEYTTVNRRFHAFIYASADKPRLAAIIDQLRETSASYLALAVRWPDPAYASQAHLEHVEIARLLSDGTPDQAASAMMDHLHNTKRQVVTLLNRKMPPPPTTVSPPEI